MGEVSQLRPEYPESGQRRIKSAARSLFPRQAHSQLKSSCQLSCLGRAQAMFPGQLRDIQRPKRCKPPVILKQALSNCDRALPGYSNPQKDGQELRIAEGFGALLSHFFTWPFLVRQIADKHSTN